MSAPFRSFVAVTALCFFLSAPRLFGQVVINEIDYDQDGTDAAEFVELYNAGSSAVDLSTYTLELVNGSGGGASVYNTIALPAVSLASHDYFVVCANAATVANCDLDSSPETNFIQNGAPDAVGLRNSGALVDAVSYEGDTGAPYVETTGVGLEDNPSLEFGGISRYPDGTDTDDNSADFAAHCISPGAENLVASSACSSGAEEKVVINEIDYDQDGTDAAEFVELYNAGTSAVDLSAYTLELVNGTGGGATVYNTIALPAVSLAAGDYFVVCANAATVPNCDLDSSPETNFIQNGAPDAVGLSKSGAVVDAVSYEGDTGAPYVETTGVGVEDDPSVEFAGISRYPDGTDTDDNSADFAAHCISPGSANLAESSSCQPVAEEHLVINEIDYDQDGTDAAEFVELYNAGSSAVDLGTYTLELVNGNGGGAVVYNTIALPSVSLSAGDFFVVCANAATVANCDLDSSPETNFIQNGAPDAVGLRKSGALVDAVSYEGDTGAPYVETTGAGVEDNPSVDYAGISRYPDGTDTDDNSADFAAHCISPGLANLATSSGCQPFAPPSIVINEIDYDQDGTDAAEFVELYNAGLAAVDLSTYTLELVNGNGGGAVVYNTIALPSVSLAAGDYFVVCANAATVVNCDLDSTPETNFIQNGAPDAVALRESGDLVDAVSYEGDTGAPYTEGSGAGLEDDPSLDLGGISRYPDGADTDQNNVDFAPHCISPGLANIAASSSCEPFWIPDVVAIHDIQGAGLTSPYAGSAVTTEGNVVTAVGPDGFFIQAPEARVDADANTSEGIFVFTGSTPSVSVGDNVDVTGTVAEFFDFTEISSGASVTVNSSGNPLPEPIALDGTVPSPDPTAPSCTIEYECYESMLVSISNGSVASGNQRFSTDPIAESYIVAGSMRPFREPGIEYPGLSGFPVWDGNPEVFELDPDRMGLPNRTLNGGSTFSAIGVIGYEFGGYELWPTSLSVTDAPLPHPVRMKVAGEATIGSLNLYRLFDDVDDPPDLGRDDEVVSTQEYARHRAKLAAYILDVLHAPDILAVEEAEKLGVLQDLASDIAALDGSVAYTAYLVEGNDIGTIDTGFLVRSTVHVDAVTQLGKEETYINPVNSQPEILHDRPPLLLVGSVITPAGNTPVAVMAVHNRSFNGIDDATEGPRVRQKRLEQAQSIAMKVQAFQNANPNTGLAVVGDFNDYQFSDGYVDAVGQIAGSFTPSDNLLSGPDLVSPDLTIQTLSLPPSERYSFIFQGSAQALDHALTTTAMSARVTGYEYGRGNADAPVELVNSDTTMLRGSDHDGLVLFVDVTPPTIVLNDAASLWPPNNKFEPYSIADIVASVNDGASVDDVYITSVTSDEPVIDPNEPDGNGDKKQVDILVDDCQNVQVRRRRFGSDGSNGRVYTIYLAVSDSVGNVGTAAFHVMVPINGHTPAVDDGPAYSVDTGCTAPPAAPDDALAKDQNSPDVLAKTGEVQPTEFALAGNYPNPFNPETTVEFSLPEAVKVSIRIYDTTGREVARLVDGNLPAGVHRVRFDASNLPSGVYLYTMRAGSFAKSKTMVLLR